MGVFDSSPFVDQCAVVANNTYNTAGTLTRADVATLTPTQLENLFRPSNQFAEMTSFFQTAFEMQACGVRRIGMWEWLMSSARPQGSLVNMVKVEKSASIIQPFIFGRQKSVINTDFWAITAGEPVSNSGALDPSTPLTASQLSAADSDDRIIRVVNRYGIDLDHKWFLDRDRVHIFNRSSGQATQGQWKVLDSAAASDGSFIDVILESENAGSSTPYDSSPSSGVLLAGVNNVNDFENWCNNRPNLNPEKRVPFWMQTIRRTRQVDSEYKKIFQKLIQDNRYFAEFGDLPLAERNRQDEEEYRRRMVHAFFFNKPISADQTLANYQSLEQINTTSGATVDPGTGGKAIAYRANFIGVYEQLRSCDRVRDLANQKLKIRELFNEIYNIQRSRKSQGRPANSIDIFTNSTFAALFDSAMIEYYKAEYGDVLRFQQDITEGRNEPLGFFWRSYMLKYPIGTQINIITNEFWDDLYSAFAEENIASRGHFMAILDLGRGGTIYPGIIGSNRKVRTTGEIERLAQIDATFACVMENPTIETTLTSETLTAMVECPSNSLWVENIADSQPDAGAVTAPEDDLY